MPKAAAHCLQKLEKGKLKFNNKWEKPKERTMASRRELQRLEDENRTLCQRLSDTEVELSRKEEELKSTNIRYSFKFKFFNL